MSFGVLLYTNPNSYPVWNPIVPPVHCWICSSSHFHHVMWLMSHWVWGCLSYVNWAGVYSRSSSDAPHQDLKTLHGVQMSPSAGRAHLQYVSQAVLNLLGFIRKAHHSHMQGTTWIKSTMYIGRIKVYVSSIFLSPNCTQCLARNSLSPLRREQSHVNECCHLHAQAASKGLSKQIALSGMNETPTMTGFCKWAIIHLRHNHIVAVSMLHGLTEQFRYVPPSNW